MVLKIDHDRKFYKDAPSDKNYGVFDSNLKMVASFASLDELEEAIEDDADNASWKSDLIYYTDF
jgi:hypothetical protein